MNFTDIPARLLKAFGLNGLKNTIPTESSTSTDNSGVATYDKGFPAITMQPLSAGGIPPSGKDVNGILYALSLKAQWVDAGMGYPFNTDFATAIGGYPRGAVIPASNGTGSWLNQIDGNTTSPESPSGATTGWVPLDNYGYTTISGLSSTSVTMTSLQAAKDRIILNGNLTSNITLLFPAWMKSWTVINNCTGNFSVTCRTASGSGITVGTSVTEKLYGDGVNVLRDFGNASQRNVGNGNTNIPDMRFFASTSNNQSLPTGITFKWGITGVSDSTGNATTTFTEPFKTSCFVVFISEHTGSTGTPEAVRAWGVRPDTVTRTGFKAFCANTTNGTGVAGEGGYYFAIGI